MALVVNDRVRETSTTTGTGTFTLAGAVLGFETFSTAIGNTNTTYYSIVNENGEFEVGLGTVGAGTLARTTIISSSNSDSAVDFSAGTKDVFCTLPASKAVILDSSGNIVANNGSNLTNLNADNLASGTVPDARFPATLPAANGSALTNLNADNLASGTVPDARFPATLPAANGSNLTALNATQLTSGTVPIARIDLDLLTVTSNDANADFFAVINSAGAQTKITKGSINNSGFNNDSGFIDGSSLNADNLSSGTVPSARVSGAYTGITQTGTLTSFTSTGIDDNATSTVITIESGGDVGIGTTNPAFSFGKGLEIENNGTATLRLQHDGVHGFEIRASSTEAEFASANAKPFTFDTGGSERMRIDSSGNVGIGTSSPGYSLDVAGVIRASTASDYVMRVGSTDGYAGILLYDGNTTAQTNNQIVAVGDNLRFKTSDTSRLNITSSGNVGIGTTSPSQTLDVSGAGARIYITGANEDISMDNSGNGQISIDGNGYNAGIALDADAMNIYTNSSSRDVVLGVNETEILRAKPAGVDVTGIVTADELNFDGNGEIHSTNDTSSIALAGGTDSNVGANIVVYGGTHASLANVVRFRAGSSETMRIDSSGNVGIGLTSPAFPLNVATPSTDGVTALFGAAVSPNAAGTYLGFADSDATAVLGVYYSGTAYPVLEITRSTRATSINANLNFGDNNKAVFGAGGDLEIYHSGSNSFIDEVGTGYLQIRASDNITLKSAADELYVNCINNGAVELYHNNNKKLETTSGGIAVTGAITATGDITAFYTSDKNLKQNIVNIDNSLDKVSKLNGVYYNWTKEALEKNTHLKDEKEVGVIAQDVEAVLPELVATREDGTKAVRYERLCAVLIESIKELKKEIEELKK